MRTPLLAPALAFGAIAAAVVLEAPAAVHKCVEDGGTTYQDRPCGATAPDPSGVADAPLSVLPTPSRRSILQREAAPKPPRAERARKPEAANRGDANERRHLRIGMSEGEVLARVGPPDFTTGKGRRSARWTWMPAPADPDTVTVLLFDTGRVVEVERTVVKR